MLGLVYTDNTIDKIVRYIGEVFYIDAPEDITNGEDVLSIKDMPGLDYLRDPFFTTKDMLLLRVANINIVEGNAYSISAAPASPGLEKIAFVSSDDINIVAYRASTYQIVTVASLLPAEIIDIGELSFADMQTVTTVAAGLTSTEIKYLIHSRGDTVTFTELT